KSQAQYRGDRAKSDITLAPIQQDAQGVDAVDIATADHARVSHGRGVGTCLGASQAEAWDFFASCKPRQPVLTLLLRTELHEQFAGPQGIRNHDGDGRRNGAHRYLPDDLRMGVRRKPQTAVFFRDDHAEKAVLLKEGPDFVG